MPVAAKRAPKARSKAKRSRLKPILIGLLLAVVSFYALIAVTLFFLRWVNPPFTAVQLERRIHSWTESAPYTKRYVLVPLNRISPNLQHAVISAEDARFFQHHGFDWQEIGNAVQEDIEDHRERGASTITQQLARNLFLSTNRSFIRKAIEFSIVPLTEAILSKRRILELYLNVMGPRNLWGRSRFALLLRCSRSAPDARTSCSAGFRPTFAVASQARASRAVRGSHSGSHASNRLVDLGVV